MPGLSARDPVRLMKPSGAPALQRTPSYADDAFRLRACRYCQRELPPMCTVFMALDSPFCSQQCRTTFVFSHVDVCVPPPQKPIPASPPSVQMAS